MKDSKFYLLIVMALFFFESDSYGQMKHFLPDSNAYLSILDMKCFINSDTLIEGNKYKKTYLTYRTENPTIEDAQYYAGVREDTLNEKVYAYLFNDTTERLIADYSLIPGEKIVITTFAPFQIYPTEIEVEAIARDSVEIDGAYRKSIVFQFNDAKEYWIEGIGSTYGLFFPAAINIQSSGANLTMLLCVHQDDKLIYDNPDFDGCFIQVIGGIDDSRFISIKIYPSPASEYIVLESDEYLTNASYRIIKPMGGVFKEGKLELGEEISISQLSKGIYFLIVSEDTQIINVQKFIKY